MPVSSCPESHPLGALWQLDPDCTYLNHGSFGPSPIPVQQAREEWSRRVERQPMRFYCSEMEAELERTCEVLAEFLGTRRDRLALVENATVAMNIVAESISLKAGDEVLLTDHEYGAVRNIWQARCREAGAKVVTAALPFPPSGGFEDAARRSESESSGNSAGFIQENGIVAAIESAIRPSTRLIVISHVTSATACRLPVQAVCRMAARHKIPVCVDGPHAVAMLDLRLDELGCDYYCASGHKWLCAPFGSGFLWVHPRHHSAIQSPMISWGGSIAGRPASWKDSTNWMGTRDPAPLLAMSDAVHFFTPERLTEFRKYSHALVVEARQALLEIPGTGAFCTPEESDFVSMAAIELPQPNGWRPGYHGHPDPLQLALRDGHGIEVPVGSWNGHRFLRVSAHLYTRRSQILKLVDAVRASEDL
jgi:isopenicillin-N epimerase